MGNLSFFDDWHVVVIASFFFNLFFLFAFVFFFCFLVEFEYV